MALRDVESRTGYVSLPLQRRNALAALVRPELVDHALHSGDGGGRRQDAVQFGSENRTTEADLALGRIHVDAARMRGMTAEPGANPLDELGVTWLLRRPAAAHGRDDAGAPVAAVAGRRIRAVPRQPAVPYPLVAYQRTTAAPRIRVENKRCRGA